MEYDKIKDILNRAAKTEKITKKVKDTVTELFGIYKKRLIAIIGYLPNEFVFLDSLSAYNSYDYLYVCRHYQFIDKNIDSYINQAINKNNNEKK
jgi:ABC-type multidrug transport system ATPase subunit